MALIIRSVCLALYSGHIKGIWQVTLIRAEIFPERACEGRLSKKKTRLPFRKLLSMSQNKAEIVTLSFLMTFISPYHYVEESMLQAVDGSPRV